VLPHQRTRGSACGGSFKGLNFVDSHDQALMRAVQCPEFNIHGLARSDLNSLLPAQSASRLSRQPRRLRVLGTLERAANTCRCCLAHAGRLTIAAFASMNAWTRAMALRSERRQDRLMAFAGRNG
jgi:hypothetical protein